MTKLFVTFTLLCVFGAIFVKGFDKDAAIAEAMANIELCMEEVGAVDSDREEIIARKASSTREGKCLRLCLHKKYEVINDNGKIDKDIAREKAHEFLGDFDEIKETVNEIIDKCSEIDVSDDHCEAAEQYGVCFREELKAHNIEEHFDLF